MCKLSGHTKAQWGECSLEDTQAVLELLVGESVSADGQGNGGVRSTTYRGGGKAAGCVWRVDGRC